MRQLKQKNRYTCLVTSLAMLLDEDVEKLINLIGHDGSEIWFPDQSEPLNRRGHSTIEAVEVALTLGKALIEIPVNPGVYNEGNMSEYKTIYAGDEIEPRLKYYLKNYNAIIVGKTTRFSMHAAAWNKNIQKVHDPKTGSIQDFKSIFYRLDSVIVAWENTCVSSWEKSKKCEL